MKFEYVATNTTPTALLIHHHNVFLLALPLLALWVMVVYLWLMKRMMRLLIMIIANDRVAIAAAARSCTS